MPDDVPEAVKRSRNNELLALQASISEQRSLLYVGREMEVFVEGLSMRERKKRERLSSVTTGTVSLTINGKDDKEHGHGSACAIDDECGTEGSSVAAPASGEIAQYSARTDTDMIVLFDQPAGASERLVGSMQRVKIHGATALSLMATLL
jgi:tRNA A37 methylthiotransferase MiaB